MYLGEIWIENHSCAKLKKKKNLQKEINAPHGITGLKYTHRGQVQEYFVPFIKNELKLL